MTATAGESTDTRDREARAGEQVGELTGAALRRPGDMPHGASAGGVQRPRYKEPTG
jgi:hypothetical protein